MGFFLIFQMKFDKSKWKELDINVDSLWIMGPRAKGGKHENVYHGNFAPQIPNQMIRATRKKVEMCLKCLWAAAQRFLNVKHLDATTSDLT